MADETNAGETAPEKTRKYTVAPGRTVDGKGPGEKVDLIDTDYDRFLQLGFVLDKDGKQRFITDGPAVNVVDGVQIKPAA